MIILHLGWNKNKLLLWGETSDSGQKITLKNKNSKKGLKIKPCPFSASAEKIAAALEDICDIKISGKNRSSAIVWLPTQGGAPISSSRIISEASKSAVYYLIGEEFSRDPFLIFKLRGLEREELIRFMGCGINPAPQKEHDGGINEEQLPSDPDVFWGKEPKCGLLEEVAIPHVSAALPARLGKFPFWRGNQNLQEDLKDIYRNASLTGMNMFLGEE